jgi:hypothetical protein
MSVWTVLAMGALLAALALAVDGAHLWMARGELRNASDAMALAAAHALLDDRLLSNQPGVMRLVLARAYQEAQSYGQANPVLGRPQELLFDPADPDNSDLIFGYRPDPNSRTFLPAADLDEPNINCVRVVARRTRQRGNPAGMFFGRLLNLPVADVVASTTVFLDRNIVGFKPPSDRPIPLVPIALLSDPSFQDSRSWESQTLAATLFDSADAADQFRYDPVARRFLDSDASDEAGDGIFEMEVVLPLADAKPGEPSPSEGANACFVGFGGFEPGDPGTWQALARQVRHGVTGRDLTRLGGQLLLGQDNLVILPGTSLPPAAGSTELQLVQKALEGLQATAEPRIWLLYRTKEGAGEGAAGERVAVWGFVAARLVQIEVVSGGQETGPGPTTLRLALQPCQMAVSAAITADTRTENPGSATMQNRYLAKVRLVND